MSILPTLRHRATVERSTSVLLDGSPHTTWSVISVREPVLYSKDTTEFDPTLTTEQRRESDQRGTLFTSSTADLKPGDRVHLTRPVGLGLTLAVLADPATVLDLHGVHHREHKVRSVA